MDDPKLAQTTFWLNSREDWCVETCCLHLDKGGHEPTPEEDLLAPFYQDPSQRILALEFHGDRPVFVMKTAILLELARKHTGKKLGWGQWRTYVIEVESHFGNGPFWVYGPRLFCMRWKEVEDVWVDVHDFSPRPSARHIRKLAYDSPGVMWQMRPNVQWCHLPWHATVVRFANGGHDSIVFLKVNALAPRARPKPDRSAVQKERGSFIVHLWNF